MSAESGLIKQVVQSKDDGAGKSETEVVSSPSTWKRDSDGDNSDALVRLMRDQLIMARAYANIAQGQGHYDLVRDLKLRIKEHTNIVGDANVDAELPAGYFSDPCSCCSSPLPGKKRVGVMLLWRVRERGLE